MKFNKSCYGMNLSEHLSKPFLMSKNQKDAITFQAYSLPKWELFKTCISREFLLMKRNSFVYVFKSLQVRQNIFILFQLVWLFVRKTKVTYLSSSSFLHLSPWLCFWEQGCTRIFSMLTITWELYRFLLSFLLWMGYQRYHWQSQGYRSFTNREICISIQPGHMQFLLPFQRFLSRCWQLQFGHV